MQKHWVEQIAEPDRREKALASRLAFLLPGCQAEVLRSLCPKRNEK